MTDKNEPKSAAEGQSELTAVVMCGVTEYEEGMDVELDKSTGKYEYGKTDEECEGFGRDVVVAKNEAGHNRTEVDLEQLLAWVAHNRPEQYMKFVTGDMMRDHT